MTIGNAKNTQYKQHIGSMYIQKMNVDKHEHNIDNKPGFSFTPNLSNKWPIKTIVKKKTMDPKNPDKASVIRFFLK